MPTIAFPYIVLGEFVLAILLFSVGWYEGDQHEKTAVEVARAKTQTAADTKADAERANNQAKETVLNAKIAELQKRPARTITRYIKIKEKLDAEHVADCVFDPLWVHYANSGRKASGSPSSTRAAGKSAGNAATAAGERKAE